MIELKNIGKIYKSKKSSDTVALKDINIKIGNTGMLFIVGKSGSGKSTLLNLLGGLDSPTSGELLINNKNISKFTKNQYDSYRNTYVGFIFQEFNVLEQYNVYENIELAMELQKKKIDKNTIDKLLDKLGISNLGKRKINELSGGQKQRVAIARALIKNPQIILADEPTGNLDRNSSEQIFNILKEISKNQLVIVVSHDMESAQKYADRIIQIDDGNIINDTNIEEDVEVKPFELKKSKLPFSYSLKMAINSFKTKPFKLFMTVLLTAISLIFMGMTVNLALFDEASFESNVMKNNNINVYDVHNTIVRKQGPDGVHEDILIEEKDLPNIRNLTKSKINVAYTLYENSEILGFDCGEITDENEYFYYKIGSINKFVEIEDDNVVGKVIGRLPQKDNELVIHKYLAEYITEYGIKTIDDELYIPKDYNELVTSNKQIKLGLHSVQIVGIVDDDNSLYSIARENKFFKNEKLKNFFFNTYASNAYTVYVKGFAKNIKLEANKESILDKLSIKNSSDYNGKATRNIKIFKEEKSIINKNGYEIINELEENQVLISIQSLRLFDNNFDVEFEKYLINNGTKTYNVALNDFTLEYIKNTNILKRLNLSILNYVTEDTSNIEVELVGISLDDNDYISNKYIQNQNPKTKEIWSVKVYSNNYKELNKVFNKIKYRQTSEEVGTYYTFEFGNYYEIETTVGTYTSLAVYILIVSLVFVLFTMLLFSNFISVSISYCKKEIGILRSLGATSKDVIKIFGYESIIIGIMSWILSIIGWYMICNMINDSVSSKLYYILDPIVTHPLVPIGMLVFTLFISILVTVLSLSRITNIKPIDAINNK